MAPVRYRQNRPAVHRCGSVQNSQSGQFCAVRWQKPVQSGRQLPVRGPLPSVDHWRLLVISWICAHPGGYPSGRCPAAERHPHMQQPARGFASSFEQERTHLRATADRQGMGWWDPRSRHFDSQTRIINNLSLAHQMTDKESSMRFPVTKYIIIDVRQLSRGSINRGHEVGNSVQESSGYGSETGRSGRWPAGGGPTVDCCPWCDLREIV